FRQQTRVSLHAVLAQRCVIADERPVRPTLDGLLRDLRRTGAKGQRNGTHVLLIGQTARQPQRLPRDARRLPVLVLDPNPDVAHRYITFSSTSRSTRSAAASAAVAASIISHSPSRCGSSRTSGQVTFDVTAGSTPMSSALHVGICARDALRMPMNEG